MEGSLDEEMNGGQGQGGAMGDAVGAEVWRDDEFIGDFRASGAGGGKHGGNGGFSSAAVAGKDECGALAGDGGRVEQKGPDAGESKGGGNADTGFEAVCAGADAEGCHQRQGACIDFAFGVETLDEEAGIGQNLAGEGGVFRAAVPMKTGDAGDGDGQHGVRLGGEIEVDERQIVDGAGSGGAHFDGEAGDVEEDGFHGNLLFSKDGHQVAPEFDRAEAIDEEGDGEKVARGGAGAVEADGNRGKAVALRGGEQFRQLFDFADASGRGAVMAKGPGTGAKLLQGEQAATAEHARRFGKCAVLLQVAKHSFGGENGVESGIGEREAVGIGAGNDSAMVAGGLEQGVGNVNADGKGCGDLSEQPARTGAEVKDAGSAGGGFQQRAIEDPGAGEGHGVAVTGVIARGSGVVAGGNLPPRTKHYRLGESAAGWRTRICRETSSFRHCFASRWAVSGSIS